MEVWKGKTMSKKKRISPGRRRIGRLWLALSSIPDDGPRQHIKIAAIRYEQWNMLKKTYGISDLATRKLALSKIARIESSFKRMQQYSEAIMLQNEHIPCQGPHFGICLLF